MPLRLSSTCTYSSPSVCGLPTLRTLPVPPSGNCAERLMPTRTILPSASFRRTASISMGGGAVARRRGGIVRSLHRRPTATSAGEPDQPAGGAGGRDCGPVPADRSSPGPRCRRREKATVATTMSGQNACAPASRRSLKPSASPPRICTPSQPSSTTSTTVAATPAAGRGSRENAGQRANATNATAAAGLWAAAGCGEAATTIVPSPPIASSSRPQRPASGRPAAVTTWQIPSTRRPVVMIQRSCAPRAARALIVSLIGSNPSGCWVCAHVQPPINATGATAAEAIAQFRTDCQPSASAAAAAAPGSADSIRDKAASSWDADTNQASKADGGRYTPASSMPWKNAA